MKILFNGHIEAKNLLPHWKRMHQSYYLTTEIALE